MGKVTLGESDKHQRTINHRNNTSESYCEQQTAHKVSLWEEDKCGVMNECRYRDKDGTPCWENGTHSDTDHPGLPQGSRLQISLYSSSWFFSSHSTQDVSGGRLSLTWC